MRRVKGQQHESSSSKSRCEESKGRWRGRGAWLLPSPAPERLGAFCKARFAGGALVCLVGLGSEHRLASDGADEAAGPLEQLRQLAPPLGAAVGDQLELRQRDELDVDQPHLPRGEWG